MPQSTGYVRLQKVRELMSQGHSYEEAWAIASAPEQPEPQPSKASKFLDNLGTMESEFRQRRALAQGEDADRARRSDLLSEEQIQSQDWEWLSGISLEEMRTAVPYMSEHQLKSVYDHLGTQAPNILDMESTWVRQTVGQELRDRGYQMEGTSLTEYGSYGDKPQMEYEDVTAQPRPEQGIGWNGQMPNLPPAPRAEPPAPAPAPGPGQIRGRYDKFHEGNFPTHYSQDIPRDLRSQGMPPQGVPSPMQPPMMPLPAPAPGASAPNIMPPELAQTMEYRGLPANENPDIISMMQNEGWQFGPGLTSTPSPMSNPADPSTAAAWRGFGSAAATRPPSTNPRDFRIPRGKYGGPDKIKHTPQYDASGVQPDGPPIVDPSMVEPRPNPFIDPRLAGAEAESSVYPGTRSGGGATAPTQSAATTPSPLPELVAPELPDRPVAEIDAEIQRLLAERGMVAQENVKDARTQSMLNAGMAGLGGVFSEGFGGGFKAAAGKFDPYFEEKKKSRDEPLETALLREEFQQKAQDRADKGYEYEYGRTMDEFGAEKDIHAAAVTEEELRQQAERTEAQIRYWEQSIINDAERNRLIEAGQDPSTVEDMLEIARAHMENGDMQAAGEVLAAIEAMTAAVGGGRGRGSGRPPALTDIPNDLLDADPDVHKWYRYENGVAVSPPPNATMGLQIVTTLMRSPDTIHNSEYAQLYPVVELLLNGQAPTAEDWAAIKDHPYVGAMMAYADYRGLLPKGSQ